VQLAGSIWVSLLHDYLKNARSNDWLLCSRMLVQALANLMACLYFAFRVRAHGGTLWPLRNFTQHLPAALRWGLGAFLLTAWLIVLLNEWNARVVLYFGAPNTQNSIMLALQQEQQALAWFTRFGLIFSAGVLAPLFEELIFRGALYNALIPRCGRLGAAGVANAFFALLHHVPANAYPLFALGLLFTWVYARTGRLLPAMLCHASNNLATLLTTI
jgi:membrane protease YdiL (CAAX protease family)